MDIKHIARLAHLSFTEEELAIMEKDMAELTEMVKELPEMSQASAYERAIMELRKDEVCANKQSREELMANAPLAVSGCFAVPKTVE